MHKKIVFALIVAACHLLAAAQGSRQLSGSYTPERLGQILVDFDRFEPVPKYQSAYWRDSIPQTMRQSYIRDAEKHLGAKWETLDIALFSEFRENGDRSRYEAFIFGKRNRLLSLAMGEIMEGEGRFMSDIMNGLFSLCEETWWGVPAHYGPKTPLVERQTLDLFSGETGGMVAWVYYMFKEPIRKAAPLLEKRILAEISRRILDEAANTREWWRTAAMNWNPWICSNWLACVLMAEPDREKQIAQLQLIFESLDAFIDGYPDDGGCDEGAHYWDRAAGSLCDCLILLKKATDGHIDLFANEKVRLMGDYLCKMSIDGSYFVNFADAAPQMTPHVGWFPYGLYLENPELASMCANVATRKNYLENPAAVYTGSYLYMLNRELMLLSHLSELRADKGKNILPFDAWLPRVQVLTARSAKSSTAGLYLAAKGGHNNESHNHNDVGSYIVYADAKPLFVDPGVGTYRKETFNGATRYGIWCMQSGYHNLPQINGSDQSVGKEFAAREVKARLGSRRVKFSLDIADAYPEAAQVKSWKRSIDFVRSSQITVTEEYTLRSYVQPSSLTFMSQAEPQAGEGVVKYRIGDKWYGLYFDPQQLSASVEKLSFDDTKFVKMWGRLYRLKLQVKSQKLSGKIVYTIKEVKK